jgi:hypothetical protein
VTIWGWRGRLKPPYGPASAPAIKHAQNTKRARPTVDSMTKLARMSETLPNKRSPIESLAISNSSGSSERVQPSLVVEGNSVSSPGNHRLMWQNHSLVTEGVFCDDLGLKGLGEGQRHLVGPTCTQKWYHSQS